MTMDLEKRPVQERFQQVPDFRLNFFVDEVGQYITDNVKLMTNLQTVAESLATKCRPGTYSGVSAYRSIRASFDKAWLADEADVYRYLAFVREALKEAIRNGKRIQI